MRWLVESHELKHALQPGAAAAERRTEPAAYHRPGGPGGRAAHANELRWRAVSDICAQVRKLATLRRVRWLYTQRAAVYSALKYLCTCVRRPSAS